MTENQFAMVSEWMVHGNINDFVKAHPDVDRLGLVGFLLRTFHRPRFVDNCIILSWRRR
jgi:hypothetical protein